MFSIWQEMFSYSFMVRAVLVGSAVSLCAALLGEIGRASCRERV